MVKRFITTLGMIALSLSMLAQTPQQFSYQAVVRNDEGKLVSEESVDLIIAILQGNADGDAVYTETQTATTNKNGLLSLKIGNGSSSDDFSAINWANGPYFLKTQIMVDGKAIETVSQLLAVPYALYAEKVANLPDMSNFVTKEELQNFSNTSNVASKDTLAYYITTTKLEDTLDYYLLDSDVPDWAKAEEKPTYDYSEIENVPEIPNVSGLATKDTLSYYTTTEKLEDTLDYYLLDSDIPDWAKAEEKPTYDYSEITNAPEIPNVEGLASKEFVKDTIAFYATTEKLEDTLDYYLLDSDVPDWAKAEEKPTYDYSEITNTPVLPSVDGLASEEFVNEKVADLATKDTLSYYAKKDTLSFYITKEKLDDTLNYYTLKSNFDALKTEYDELRERVNKSAASNVRGRISDKCDVKPVKIYQGALLSTFSVASNRKVVFSQGNLQYSRVGTHATADGIDEGTWRFAEHQYDAVGGTSLGIYPEGKLNPAGKCGNVYYNGVKCDNLEAVINEEYEGWFDLFAFGTSGWNNGKLVYKPGQFTDWNSSPGDYISNFNGNNIKANWGQYNYINIGEDREVTCNLWRILSKDEWKYLFFQRTNATALFATGIIHLDTPTEDGITDIYGIILLPDNWTENPEGCDFNHTATPSSSAYSYSDYNMNSYTESQWALMQSYGAVFLPCTGTLRYDYRYSDREDNLCYTHAVYTEIYGAYWTADEQTSYLKFDRKKTSLGIHNQDWAMSVRLVADVE